MKHRLGSHLISCAVLLVDDHFVVAVLPRVDERAAGVDGDAFVAEGGLDRAGDVVVDAASRPRFSFFALSLNQRGCISKLSFEGLTKNMLFFSISIFT